MSTFGPTQSAAFASGVAASLTVPDVSVSVTSVTAALSRHRHLKQRHLLQPTTVAATFLKVAFAVQLGLDASSPAATTAAAVASAAISSPLFVRALQSAGLPGVTSASVAQAPIISAANAAAAGPVVWVPPPQPAPAAVSSSTNSPKGLGSGVIIAAAAGGGGAVFAVIAVTIAVCYMWSRRSRGSETSSAVPLTSGAAGQAAQPVLGFPIPPPPLSRSSTPLQRELLLRGGGLAAAPKPKPSTSGMQPLRSAGETWAAVTPLHVHVEPRTRGAAVDTVAATTMRTSRRDETVAVRSSGQRRAPGVESPSPAQQYYQHPARIPPFAITPDNAAVWGGRRPARHEQLGAGSASAAASSRRGPRNWQREG